MLIILFYWQDDSLDDSEHQTTLQTAGASVQQFGNPPGVDLTNQGVTQKPLKLLYVITVICVCMCMCVCM